MVCTNHEESVVVGGCCILAVEFSKRVTDDVSTAEEITFERRCRRYFLKREPTAKSLDREIRNREEKVVNP